MLPRLASLLASIALFAAVSACDTLPTDPYIDCDSEFSKVITTDYTGNVISEWTAAGKVKYDSGDSSYSFLAVEKIAVGRVTVIRRYVIGRQVKVASANVAVYPTAAPDWICQGGKMVAPVGD